MSKDGPTEGFQAALSKFAEAAPVQQSLVGEDGLPIFVAAHRFQGAKPGYLFSRGAFGVG